MTLGEKNNDANMIDSITDKRVYIVIQQCTTVYTITHITHNTTKHPTMIGFQREDFFSITAPLLFLSLKEVAARIFLRFTTNIIYILVLL